MVKKSIVLIIIVTLFIFFYYANQGKDIEDVLDHWFDEDDYHGIIYNRPEEKVGSWTIGDKTFNIVESTRLDEENGPAVVGQCVEVEFDNNSLTEIETTSQDRCKK
jgi:hypothetical protein